MKYYSVLECSILWGVSERTVRNYCAKGRIPGAVLKGKTWCIPVDAERPERINKRETLPRTLPERLRAERRMQQSGGIYQKLQIDMAYHSNRIGDCFLSLDQTRSIYETGILFPDEVCISVDNVVETANHFRCVDLVVEHAAKPLSEGFIKELHRTLLSGTSLSRRPWFAVGGYKKLANEIDGQSAAPPALVPAAMAKLLREYDVSAPKTLAELLDFHVRFERIHPFQDGNGRVGRLILLKECLRCGVVPFLIEERHRALYERGMRIWDESPEDLLETCLLLQDDFMAVLDSFGVRYDED